MTERLSPGDLIEVALPLPLDQTFTYRAGPDGAPAVGTRVLVPFGRDEKVGWVVGHPDQGPRGRKVRPLLSVLDREPTVSAEILELARWMAAYYVAPLGITLRAASPAVLTDSSRHVLSLVENPVDPGSADRGELPSGGGPGGVGAGEMAAGGAGGTTRREAAVLEGLRAAAGPRSVRGLRKALDMGSIWPEVRALVARGLIEHEVVPPAPPPVKTRRVVEVVDWVEDLQELEARFGRARRQREAYDWLAAAGGRADLKAVLETGGFSRAVIAGLEERGLVTLRDEEVMRDPFRDQPTGEAPRFTPTPDQARVLEGLVSLLDEDPPPPALVHGITGSGKTLVYIELLREVVLGRGRSAIVLVPEISLTPQTTRRFREQFGDLVAVLHSGLSDGERYDAWRQLRSGEKRIAVGARSAIFAPLPDLGAVIVDEEHEGTYKQSEAPRYHGRDLAVLRAVRAGALCVLGSATPSLETWSNARSGKYRHFSLPERATGQPLPPVRVVDLREARKTGSAAGGGPGGQGSRGSVLAQPLVEAVADRLTRGEQAILLLNRRGYSAFVQCQECGDVRVCPHCSISLTYHRVTSRVLCHHCRYEEPAPRRCERCGSTDLSFRGLGTEQVERVVSETFPSARVARMDVDTTSGKWAHHEILGRVERKEVDILLGTQMIAKGLDFHSVTLVGVINADVGIHLPDFRASERAYQLLSQVAGRTGRGALGGEVIVQTSLPDHFVIRHAVDHDYEGFARRELSEREDPPYPPHVRLANVILSSPEEERAAKAAEAGARWLRNWATRHRPDLDVVGPAPSPIERLHGRWRWHFLFRGATPGTVGAAARALMDQYGGQSLGDVRVSLDRDPVALL
jgi:primosomal protein N' (replication factor Y)